MGSPQSRAPARRPADDRALVLRAKAWEYRIQLWSLGRIATELGVETITVSKWLEKTRDEVADGLQEEARRVTAEQIQQLGYIADEAMQAWHRSKEASKRVARSQTQEGSANPSNVGQVTTTSQVAVDQDGDPRYLDVAMRALGDIRKLVGAEAPAKSELTLRRGVDEMSDAELQQILIEERARERAVAGHSRRIEPAASGQAEPA